MTKMQKTNKINLVVDFNNISFRSMFFISAKYGKDMTFDSDLECAQLIRKVATDMSYIMKIFSPDNVVVCCDSINPWRKKYLESLPEEQQYKKNRKKDETKNWDMIWKSLTDLEGIFRRDGFTVSVVNNAEADDLAALWKDELFTKKGESIIYVTADKDWLQLLDFNPANDSFVVSFNPIDSGNGKKRISCTQSFMDWMKDNDTDIFFTNFDAMKEKMNRVVMEDSKIVYDVVDPNGVLMMKIFCGDPGDNIPSLYSYYKNGKRMSITELKLKKIMDMSGFATPSELDGKEQAIKESIEKVFKRDATDLDVSLNLNRQRKLVELSLDQFPGFIKNDFAESIIGYEKNYGKVDMNGMNMQSLLKDSKYVSDDYDESKIKENDIFKGLDSLDRIIGGVKIL